LLIAIIFTRARQGAELSAHELMNELKNVVFEHDAMLFSHRGANPVFWNKMDGPEGRDVK
jgi:hypothetical protein